MQIFGIMMAVMAPFIVIAFISEYFKYKKSTNAKLADLHKELKRNSKSELQTEVLDLKSRIQVLEAIVTDRGYDLGRKIANL